MKMARLRRLALALHRRFAANETMAAAYLRFWSATLAVLPDENPLKRRVANTLRSVAWPPVVLPPRQVELGASVEAWLRPVPGSLAFRTLFQRQLGHEPEVYGFLSSRLARYDAVVEIGANIGAYTAFFSKALAPLGGVRVFAFEPSPRAFEQLRENLRLNGCDNVAASQCAVTCSNEASFFENATDLMKGSLDPAIAGQFAGCAQRPVRVELADCAQLAAAVGSFARVLLKVDVVGSEPDVLAALRALIEQRRPDIVVGVWSENLAGLNRLDLLRAYRLSRIEGGGLAPRDRFSDPDYCNYFLEAGGG